MAYPPPTLTTGAAQPEFDPQLPTEDLIFGCSAQMARVRLMVNRVAATSIPALIHGESGTGKELIARLLHANSANREGPFVQVNCPSLPASLVESELFGYERGAFTGAASSKPGRVEMADGGTLFLDEIGDFALELQAKLLQLLQDGHFVRIGAHLDQQVQARVVCATNRDLGHEVERGQFRRDLYYRINAVTIELPPLRQRAGDIPLLVDYFLRLYGSRYQRPAPPLSLPARQALASYSWPGNIRQLQNVIKRLVILGSEEVIAHEVAGQEDAVVGLELDGGAERSLKEITRTAIEKLEKVVIARSLRQHNWNRREVSQSLKISYRALLYKLKKFETSGPQGGGNEGL
ncbi:MAG: sigma 54-interacting transcriptional regulator [Terriglobales bacterium]